MTIDNELRALAGLPIEVEGFKIYQKKLSEITDIGYTQYSFFMQIFSMEIEDIFDDDNILDEIEENQLNLFDVIISLEAFEELITESLKYFLHEDMYILKNQNIISNIDGKKIISRDNYEKIFETVRNLNGIKIEKYNPNNQQAKKLIRSIKRNKKSIKTSETINLSSMISGLTCKSPNINIFNVWDLTMYQFYDQISRLNVVDNYHNVLQGLYSGTIDKDSIDYKNINWMKILKD